MSYSPRPAASLLAAVLAVTLLPTAGAADAGPARGGPPRASPGDDPCPAGGRDRGGPESGWELSTTRPDQEDASHAHVGNGYLGQRVPPNGTGYTRSDRKTGWPLFTPGYDGSFVSGLYAHNTKTAENRQAVAAIPNWSALAVRAGGETFDSSTPATRISGYRQSVHLRCGLVRTSLTWTAADGRATDLVYDVLADRTNEHGAAVRMRMTPRWSGDAHVTDGIDGRAARRVTGTGGGAKPGRTIDVAFRTHGTKTDGAVASTLRTGPNVRAEDGRRTESARDMSARQEVGFPVRSGRTYDVTKYVGVDTGLTSGAPEKSAVEASRSSADRGWPALFSAHATAWRKLWRSDIEVPGRPEIQKWARSSRYGLLSSTRRGARNSIAPAGLTSDNYAGQVFWDAETWMFPSLLASDPDLARSVVDYRYRTRAAARSNARKLGHEGLFYAWTSGGRGDLWKECHSWDPPHCRTQNHLQSDIALAVWQYYRATGDTTWLRTRGWPVLKGIAEFWAHRANRNEDGSYSVKNVAGPDEYSNGVDDGVFTNAGAATSLRNATRAARLLGEDAPGAWSRVADGLRIPYDKDKGVFRQYDGYKGSMIKQADTALLMYPLEWPMSRGAATRTLDYYAARTDPDGPAMTDSVHAIDAAATGEAGCSTYTYLMRSAKPFFRGDFAQFSEARGDKAGAADPHAGTPAQDFLTGKGGFLQVFTNGLTGMRWRGDAVHLDPLLPPQMKDGVNLRGLHWQGRTFDVEVGQRTTTVRLTDGKPFEVESPRGRRTVSENAPAVLETRRPDLAPTGNLARCRTASAGSEEPGMYAGAAADGSGATSWTPGRRQDSLRVDLGGPARIERIAPEWTKPRPGSRRLQTSVDGKHWRTVEAESGSGELRRPVLARHVRVTVRGAEAGDHPGIAELVVDRADGGSGG